MICRRARSRISNRTRPCCALAGGWLLDELARPQPTSTAAFLDNAPLLRFLAARRRYWIATTTSSYRGFANGKPIAFRDFPVSRQTRGANRGRARWIWIVPLASLVAKYARL